MKFSYTLYRDCLMPIIPFFVSRGEQRYFTEALVDSGAASSIFDAELAELLGIVHVEESDIRLEFEGVSGHRIVGYQHDVTLEIGGNTFHAVPIAFTRDISYNALNILGQQDFFKLFPITFNYQKKEFDIHL